MLSIAQMNTQSFADARKMEFYGTVNEDGTAHITLLNSMYQLDEDTVAWGEYCHGFSKINQKTRRDVAFLTVDDKMRKLFRGRAVYDHQETSGEICEKFNSIPRFRYNNLYGYRPIHFLSLKELSGMELVNATKWGQKSRAVASTIHPGDTPEALSVLSRRYFEDSSGFKVLGWVGKGGAVQLLPLPQCVLTAANRVVFTPEPYGEELAQIPDGATVAVYAVMVRKMQSVLVKGILERTSFNNNPYYVVDVNSVYSPMLPKNGFIYPKTPPQPVTEWKTALWEYNV